MNISEISIGTISTFGSNASLINYLKKALWKKAKSVSLMAYQVSDTLYSATKVYYR